ncbi:MAG: hypothetical protein ACI4L2_02370 [Wujia sp.]
MEQEQEKKKRKVNAVSGYVFQSPSEAKRALKEQEYITNLKRTMDPENLDGMLQLYERLTSKGYFVTPVGFSFLHELREYLSKQGYHLERHPIPVLSRSKASGEDDARMNKRYEEVRLKQEQSEKTIEKLNTLRIRLTVAVIALIITVVGMLFIVATSDNLGYYNAEQKVLDKYAHWEEELDAREQELLEWEEELKKQSEQ